MTERISPQLRRSINEQEWVYCTKCGEHWHKPNWPYSVTLFHLECDGNIEICYAPLRCAQFRRTVLDKR